MSFNEGVRSDSGRVNTSRGRGAAIGGGSLVALVAVFLIYQFTGVDLSGVVQPADTGGQGAQTSQDLSHCQTGADANQYTECRMVTTADSLDNVWNEQLSAQQTGVEYVMPGFTIFEEGVTTGCGSATSAVGPFYCPSDQSVYLDLGFFQQMERDFGAADAPLAQEYVVAHEWGHHIQNISGIFQRANVQETGPQGDAVRLELQADCLAGIWMHWASTTIDPDSGVPFLKAPTREEIATALQTAAAIGDDRIQEKTQGQTNPDTWTHGSAEQRQTWLMTGLESGHIGQCDTFAAPRV